MKNILGEEAKYHILIRAKKEVVEPKFADQFPKDEFSLCYWTVGVAPKREGILSVLFTDGVNVFAEGSYYGLAKEGDKPCIEFFGLDRVNYPQPKKAPTRGFTYVELDEIGLVKRML